MIRRLFQQSSSINHFKFIRSISNVQSLCSNYFTNQESTSHQENTSQTSDDISEDLITASSHITRNTIVGGNTREVKKFLAHANLTHKFKYFLNCSEEEAKRMLKENKKLVDIEPSKISSIIEHLYENDISVESIINNSWLFLMNKEYLSKKITRLRLLKPKNVNDFVPLLQISHLAINRLIRICDRERKVVPEGNRIYFLAQRLNVEPALVAKYVATHLFMFDISFEMLSENLSILHDDYKIEAINILKDLWAFKYYPKSIKDRLERCRLAGKENLKPWMVRCPEDVLENSLKITQENKDLLGDNSIIEYISQRLGYDIEAVKNVVQRHPAILKCRGTKVKEVLDYLIDEEKYQPIEIVRVIRILTHSLETTKMRLEELRSVGCRPSTLSIVCRSQREYQKFLNEWMNKNDNFA